MGCLKVVGIIVSVIVGIVLLVLGGQYIIGVAVVALIMWAIFPSLGYGTAFIICVVLAIFIAFATRD